MTPPLAYALLALPAPFDSMLLAATPTGLCWSAFEAGVALPALRQWASRQLPGAAPAPDDTPLLALAREWVSGYLAGQLSAPLPPLDLRGTPFQRAVWQAVLGIPPGTTATYGEIAASVGRPHAARAVGGANGSNPLTLFVPCHRLVGHDGTLRGYGGGAGRKAALLALERAARPHGS